VNKMELDFDKFVKDLEKREAENIRPMTQEQIEHHQLLMRRNFRGRELHNNRIVWRR